MSFPMKAISCADDGTRDPVLATSSRLYENSYIFCSSRMVLILTLHDLP